MSEPVTWTFRPDWSNRVVERLEWVTGILGSTVGAEQAIAVRYAQRRSVEARFVAEGRERSFMALMIERLGSGTFRVPLWFHRALLVSPVAASATSLPCDTVNREFRAGDFALLVGPDAFTCETVEITAVSGTELTLAAGVDADWPAGTVVHPLRTAWMEVSSRQNPTARVSEGNIRFEIDAGEDIDSGVETLPLYNGLPLLVQQPNWAESLGNGYAWLRDEHDSKTGLRIFADTAGRAFRTTRYGLLLHGRAEQAGFRALLRRLRGRQGAVWMPAHTWDVELAAGAASGGTALEIARIGLNEIGGYSPEIAHLLFADGTAVEWSALEAPADPANERLTMAAPLPRDFAAGERGTFIQAARLDQDTITITHETDSDGAATVALSWTAIDDSRDGSASGALPIPETAMTAGGCCDEESATRFPVTMSVPIPGPPAMPRTTMAAPVGDTVQWAVGGYLPWRDPYGRTFRLRFAVGSMEQFVDGTTMPATMTFTRNQFVWNEDYSGGDYCLVTVTGERSGATISINVTTENDLMTPAPPDLGAIPSTDTNWLIRNVEGKTDAEWNTSTPAPGAPSGTLSFPSESGPLVAGGTDTFITPYAGETGYDGYFAPYLASLT